MSGHQARLSCFSDFYPFYLSQHRKAGTRALHVAGTICSLAFGATAVAYKTPALLAAGFAAGYGFAWVGHFFVEKNKPATFTYPLWSLAADFKFCWQVLTGNQRIVNSEAD